MQFTVRPARFTIASQPSIAEIQSPNERPSQRACFQVLDARACRRERIVTCAPLLVNDRAMECPRNPLPPAITIRLPCKSESNVRSSTRIQLYCISPYQHRSKPPMPSFCNIFVCLIMARICRLTISNPCSIKPARHDAFQESSRFPSRSVRRLYRFPIRWALRHGIVRP